jgi:hypothetical protein
MFGLLAFLLAIIPFLVTFPQGHVLAVFFSIPGMLSGLIAVYLNMKYTYVPTIKCLGLWGMVLSSLPVLSFMLIIVMYNLKH